MSQAPKPVQKPEAPLPAGPSFVDFLTGTPVLAVRAVHVSSTAEHTSHGGVRHSIKLPVLQLHCPHSTCGGIRHFDPHDGDGLFLGRFKPNVWWDQLVHYQCRNCRRTEKTYALRYRLTALDAKTTEMIKIGEIPAFGEPRPNVVKDVLDDEIKFFERGYRGETAGLGIGAFAYYRRFVESHKDKIIAEIRKVAVAQGAKEDVLATLDKAATMNSFENAVRR